MDVNMENLTAQLRSVTKRLRQEEKNARARDKRANTGGCLSSLRWMVLAAYFAADQSLELATHCWCHHQAQRHAREEDISRERGRTIVEQWIRALTPADASKLTTPTSPSVKRAVAKGENFAKQAGVALWVMEHNKNRGHAPTTKQLLSAWGTPAVERTATADNLTPSPDNIRGRHAMAAVRWRRRWFATVGRVRVREHLNVDAMRNKVRRPD